MRNDSAVINQSSSGKMLLSGAGVDEAIDWLFASDVEREPGFVTSSLVLNTEGGVEADVAVYTLDPATRWASFESKSLKTDLGLTHQVCPWGIEVTGEVDTGAAGYKVSLVQIKVN